MIVFWRVYTSRYIIYKKNYCIHYNSNVSGILNDGFLCINMNQKWSKHLSIWCWRLIGAFVKKSASNNFKLSLLVLLVCYYNGYIYYLYIMYNIYVYIIMHWHWWNFTLLTSSFNQAVYVFIKSVVIRMIFIFYYVYINFILVLYFFIYIIFMFNVAHWIIFRSNWKKRSDIFYVHIYMYYICTYFFVYVLSSYIIYIYCIEYYWK